MTDFDIVEMGFKIVPIIVIIAKTIMEKLAERGGITEQERAAMALFDALVNFIEATP